MKKIVLAAVLATASLAASAQVTLSGKVSEWVDNTKVGSTKTTSLVTEPTSNFAVGASEKLGKDLVARAVVETSLSGNTIDGSGTQLGDRQMTVGFANKLGSVDLGRNVHSHFLAVTSNDAFSTLYGSVAGDIHNLRGLRMGDAVFVSVNPVKNVALSYDRAQGGAEAFGFNGAVMGTKVSLARYQHGNETSNVFALNRKFGKTTAFYSHSDDKGAVNSKGDLVGVTHRKGHVTLKASYGRQTNDLNPFVTGPSPKPDTSVKAYALGADYHFSKRTEVGVALKNVDRFGADSDVKTLGLGFTHRF